MFVSVPVATVKRLDAVDALRGLAMLWMTVFHFCFDLNQSGYIRQDFYHDAFWTWQRTLIVSLFLLCAGIGQAIALRQGQSWGRFWRRWSQVMICALLVSTGSWWMYPQSFIYFGVLHGIAAMLIIVRLTAHWGRWLWLLGALAIAAKFVGASALQTLVPDSLAQLFNTPLLNWLGLITRLPETQDYVPLLPWLGLMWWGAAFGSWLTGDGQRYLSGPIARQLQPLALMGRWSLSYYMLHQPLLIGTLLVFGWLVRY